MLRVGLTGGIACGKSTVAKMFRELGAHVVQSDRIAHDLYRPGEPVYQEIVRRFGPDIVKADGDIDRPRLAAVVFGQGRIEELNRIVHPAVIERQGQWMQETAARDPQGIAIAEAALIFEAGVGGRFEKMIVVTCTPEQKVQRYAQREGISEESARAEVERRSHAQWPDEVKVKQADYVIDNSGELEKTRQQVERVWKELRQKSN